MDLVPGGAPDSNTTAAMKSPARHRSRCYEDGLDFAVYGVVPGMVVAVTVVRESGHSTTEPDTSCTGM